MSTTNALVFALGASTQGYLDTAGDGGVVVKCSNSLNGDCPEFRLYTIQAGDTLSRLARRFSTSVLDLQNLNWIDNPDLIRAGTTIRVPR